MSWDDDVIWITIMQKKPDVYTDSSFLVKRIYKKSSKKQKSEDAGRYPYTRGHTPRNVS